MSYYSDPYDPQRSGGNNRPAPSPSLQHTYNTTPVRSTYAPPPQQTYSSNHGAAFLSPAAGPVDFSDPNPYTSSGGGTGYAQRDHTYYSRDPSPSPYRSASPSPDNSRMYGQHNPPPAAMMTPQGGRSSPMYGGGQAAPLMGQYQQQQQQQQQGNGYGGAQPGDVFGGPGAPSPAQVPAHSAAPPPSAFPQSTLSPAGAGGYMASRPSYSSQRSDMSYSSSYNLNKEWGVGEVVPPLPTNSPMGFYPPRPSPQPYPGSPLHSAGWSGTAMWHDVRQKLLERRVVKQIPLSNGNLIYDVPVPKGCIPTTKGLGCEPEEMEKLRYSAATCDPDDFMRSKFSLRQYLYGRQTELFIVMTMYNEGADLLLRTLNAVIKNIAHLCSRDRSKTWGPGSWKKVVVCIVADGRKIVDPRVLKVLQLMGVYAEGVAKDHVGSKEVTAHCFEYTSQVVVSPEGEVGFGSVPVQMLFCLKEKNQKKINSHRWFFNAFGPLLKPNVCVLLDVGTKPSGTSIYELYKCFEKNKNVGGACGEIFADTGKFGKQLLNPIVAGQNFEYKMSNILDKPFESVFGLIAVLPGAFSAYRYAAVANHPDGTGPLASYFHGEIMNLPGSSASIFDRNKFLAEDRILAFEIVTKKNARWTLRYVKSAKAGTDVPTGVPEFISQRRRWLNGSIFAATYSIACFWRIWTSGHGFFRKIALNLLTIYNLINLLFNWFSISSFYLAFYFLLSATVNNTSGAQAFGEAGDEIFQVFNKVYIALIFIVVICSLSNRPQGSNWYYTGCIVLFAACQGILLYCAGWTVYQTVPHTTEGWKDVKGLFQNRTFLDMAMSLMATYGLYLISSILYFEPWHMFTSFIQYLLLLPSYVNILLIFAMANLHDVSWGTKGDNGASKDLGQVKKVEKDGQELAEVAIPTRQEDVEALWQQARQELRTPEKEQKEKRNADTKRSDDDRNFRTNVLLLFLGSNMVLILLFTSPVFTNWINSRFTTATSSAFNPYLTVIFYAVLGLSVMRFIGCILYLIFRLFGH